MSPTAFPQNYSAYRLDSRNSFDDLKLVSLPLVQPGPDEVLVKLHAGSLQFRDLMIAKSMYPLPMKDNVIPGSDAAGEIVAVGPISHSPTAWKVGDRVAGNFTQLHTAGVIRSGDVLKSALGGGTDGVFAEYRLFTASGLVKIPDNYSYVEASTLPCAALTAYNALYGSGSHVLKPGQWVLAQGTGGVSVWTLQFAISTGAHCIITSSSDAKLAKVKSLAGDRAHLVHTINYKTNPDWEKEVAKIIPTGVHFVVEVGGSGTIERSFQSLAFGGMIASIGFVAGEAATPVPNINGLALSKGATLRGILIGNRDQFEDMNAHIQANNIKPLVDRIFPFAELKQGYEYLASQKHVGKVVIQISQ